MTERRLKYHRTWVAIGFALVGALVVLSLVPAPPAPLDFEGADKLEHLAGYALLMSWFMQIYQQRATRARVAGALVALGFVIEVLQGFSALRHFDYVDALANTLGVLLAWWLVRPPLSRVLWQLEQRFA
ncbi:MAG: VanZ family protein [Thiohalomonadaceae bacterium]